MFLDDYISNQRSCDSSEVISNGIHLEAICFDKRFSSVAKRFALQLKMTVELQS